jgi:hypothetical protein
MSMETFRALVLDLAVRWVCSYTADAKRREYLFLPVEMMSEGAGPRRVRVTFELLPDPAPDLFADFSGAIEYIVETA